MARPLRLEIPGAVYHVTAIGNAGQAVFRTAEESELFLGIVGQACARFGWRCFAYCLLPDRYHLVVKTQRPTLARGMRQINGCYTQAFNRRHGIGGHLFQGRYRAVMVEQPGFVAAACRDVLRRPLDLGLAPEPGAWRWSSHRAVLGRLPQGRAAPNWLAVDDLLALYGPADDRGGPDGAGRAAQRRRYEDDVADAGRPPVWENLHHQVFLGSEPFAAAMRERAKTAAARRGSLEEIPKAQWQAPPPPLEGFVAETASREEAMARAYLSGSYSQARIARHFGVHYSTVSRAVRRLEKTLEEAAAVTSNNR